MKRSPLTGDQRVLRSSAAPLKCEFRNDSRVESREPYLQCGWKKRKFLLFLAREEQRGYRRLCTRFLLTESRVRRAQSTIESHESVYVLHSHNGSRNIRAMLVFSTAFLPENRYCVPPSREILDRLSLISRIDRSIFKRRILRKISKPVASRSS